MPGPTNTPPRPRRRWLRRSVLTLVVIAAVLTVWSMLYYLRRAWPILRDGASKPAR